MVILGGLDWTDRKRDDYRRRKTLLRLGRGRGRAIRRLELSYTTPGNSQSFYRCQKNESITIITLSDTLTNQIENTLLPLNRDAPESLTDHATAAPIALFHEFTPKGRKTTNECTAPIRVSCEDK